MITSTFKELGKIKYDFQSICERLASSIFPSKTIEAQWKVTTLDSSTFFGNITTVDDETLEEDVVQRLEDLITDALQAVKSSIEGTEETSIASVLTDLATNYSVYGYSKTTFDYGIQITLYDDSLSVSTTSSSENPIAYVVSQTSFDGEDTGDPTVASYVYGSLIGTTIICRDTIPYRITLASYAYANANSGIEEADLLTLGFDMNGNCQIRKETDLPIQIKPDSAYTLTSSTEFTTKASEIESALKTAYSEYVQNNYGE